MLQWIELVILITLNPNLCGFRFAQLPCDPHNLSTEGELTFIMRMLFHFISHGVPTESHMGYIAFELRPGTSYYRGWLFSLQTLNHTIPIKPVVRPCSGFLCGHKVILPTSVSFLQINPLNRPHRLSLIPIRPKVHTSGTCGFVLSTMAFGFYTWSIGWSPVVFFSLHLCRDSVSRIGHNFM